MLSPLIRHYKHIFQFLAIALLSLSLFSASCLCASVNQNNDFQLWVTEEVNKQFSSVATVRISNEWRFGDDASKLYYFDVQGVATFRLNDWSDFAPGYKQIWTLRESEWFLNYEPLINYSVRLKKGVFEWELRNRISYLFREQQKDVWLYRGRLRWVTNWVVGETNLKPYFSNEVFIQEQDAFFQDRIILGLVFPITNMFDADFYGMIRFLKNQDRWTHQNIFGTWFNFRF
jgi:hypothetical protein